MLWHGVWEEEERTTQRWRGPGSGGAVLELEGHTVQPQRFPGSQVILGSPEGSPAPSLEVTRDVKKDLKTVRLTKS